jgi:K+-transporting ATPase KdpF subunit
MDASKAGGSSATEGAQKSHAGCDLCDIDAGVFRGGSVVHEILRWIEVGKMLDTIVSLAVCVGLLVYLVYAMLRPEKF